MTIFKSINIVEDFGFPARASHYRPTSRSLEIVRAVVGQGGSRATSVIATYGSGKSLAAMVGGLIVEADRDKISALDDAGIRMRDFDPSISGLLDDRLGRGIKGAVLPLAGHVPDLAAAICRGLGLEVSADMAVALKRVEAWLRDRNRDRIAIIWDEFGRHLEALAAQGRAEELTHVQDLAEWVARRKFPSATLTLLLHQEFHRYSGRLGQSEQAAWKKIEGRFDTLRIVEDSDEIYRFIADVISDLGIPGRKRITAAIARQAHHLPFFPFINSDAEMRDMLERASPLTPSALYLLPKIAGRVGQSERTIFGFISAEMPADQSELVCIEDVYRYFSDAMRTDIGVGGAHKRFIETESARGRSRTPVEREVLAAAALLHLAGAASSGQVSRDRLLGFTDLGSRHGRKAIDEAIDALLARKLLIHRKLTDDVSVWQGSDIDIRALLSEKCDSLRGATGSVRRIEAHVPAPVYLASEYNFRNSITRFARGIFVELADLQDPRLRAPILLLAENNDAVVALVVDGTAEDFEAIRGDWMAENPHLIVALPDERPDLASICLEAAALSELISDEDLLGMDPLVERELKDLRENALEYLSSRAALLTDPDAGGVSWYSAGRLLGQGDGLNVSDVLTRIFMDRFPASPRVSNEQIVRNRTTAQTKSARKRLLLGILERSGVPDMGYADATSSDASIYRTTLVATGLYDRGRKKWAEPGQLEDPGMALAWAMLREFYSSPGAIPKPFSAIVDTLRRPPFGVRKGLLPILVTAGLRAFGEVIAIRKNVDGRWLYIDDIQPSTMEEICDTPESFEIEVIRVSKADRDLIVRLIAEFSALPDAVENDLIRAFYDALVSWRRTLPAGALQSRVLGEAASKFQTVLRQTASDPVSLLFRALPSIAGRRKLDAETVLFVSEARRQIERMTARYVEDAIATARAVFSTGLEGGEEAVLSVAERWAAGIPKAVAADPSLDRVAKGVLNRARRADSGRDSEASFVRALSAMLVGLDFEAWDDGVAKRFSRELRIRVREIEDAVLSLGGEDPDLAPFLEQRISAYIRKLAASAGQDRASALISKLGRMK